jgi:acyl-CoA thioesterase-2
LLRVLDLEPAGADRFIGQNEIDRHGRIYGGQAIAQSLMAAARCVPHSTPTSAREAPLRRAHSLHAYFLLLGDPERPVEFEVTRLRDGRSFSQRRVTARQQGQPILEMLCSFHIDDTGYEHALPMPRVPAPEGLQTPEELVRVQLAGNRIPADSLWAVQPRSMEMRHEQVPAYLGGEPSASPSANWFRSPIALPDDPILHQCLIAYTTDMSFNDHSARHHSWRGPLGRPDMTSLDHAVWFHAPARVDEWLLFHGMSPFGGRARGFVRGEIFTEDGRMVASVAQECLLRPRHR